LSQILEVCFKAGQFFNQGKKVSRQLSQISGSWSALRLVFLQARKEGFRATVSDLGGLPAVSQLFVLTLLEHRREGRTAPHL
ncbi:rCG20036, partial [Rattus norvegicus]